MKVTHVYSLFLWRSHFFFLFLYLKAVDLNDIPETTKCSADLNFFKHNFKIYLFKHYLMNDYV